MSRRLILLFATLIFCFPLGAQVTTTAQNYTVQVSTTESWTDSGLDLKAGDSLEISATAASQANTIGRPCDPNGMTVIGVASASLPVPSAPPGALIARLHEQGSPVLVGASREFHIVEASHLMLGMNMSGTSLCQGELVVKVHVTPSGSSAASTSDTSQTSRGQQLKSQLGTAAQIFMQGQFGMGNSEAGTSNSTSTGATSGTGTPALKVSSAPLEAQLRKNLDTLPRRVNDQFHNQGDMVNFVIVGSQKDVQTALDAASWHVADTGNENAVLNAVMQTYDSKDYLAMPMSTLYLFGRKQDFGYEMAEPIAMVASRHHFRIWKAPFLWNGSEVWCGAGTHDIGFAKDKRNGSVTHKIDPAVDGERENIGSSLQKANKVKTLTYYLPPNPVQDAKNATGDGYHSDGRLLVMFLQ